MRQYYNSQSVWLIMFILTLTSYVIGELKFSGLPVVLFVLTIAFIKGILIIREFMVVKNVSLIWKILMYGWLASVCLAMSIAYIIQVLG